MLINIFKIVSKDENEANEIRMIVFYPQDSHPNKNSIFIHKVTANRSRKNFSILCFAQQVVIESEGVLNSYNKTMLKGKEIYKECYRYLNINHKVKCQLFFYFQHCMRNIYFIEENRNDRTKSRNCDISCSR